MCWDVRVCEVWTVLVTKRVGGEFQLLIIPPGWQSGAVRRRMI